MQVDTEGEKGYQSNIKQNYNYRWPNVPVTKPLSVQEQIWKRDKLKTYNINVLYVRQMETKEKKGQP